MEEKNKSTSIKNKTVKAVLDAVMIKKEIKLRFQNGEKLREIAKEKGFEIVLPL